GEMMALGTGLRAIGGIGAGFFPRRAGLCAKTRRRTARSILCQRRGRSAGGDGATWPPNTRVPPSAENGDAVWNLARTLAAPASPGIGSAGRRGRRRESAEAVSMVAHQSAGTLRSGAAARAASTDRQVLARSLAPLVCAASPSPHLHSAAPGS